MEQLVADLEVAIRKLHAVDVVADKSVTTEIGFRNRLACCDDGKDFLVVRIKDNMHHRMRLWQGDASCQMIVRLCRHGYGGSPQRTQIQNKRFPSGYCVTAHTQVEDFYLLDGRFRVDV